MTESAAHLVDNVIPKEPVRQWVISFPIPLRILFAYMDVGKGREQDAEALLHNRNY